MKKFQWISLVFILGLFNIAYSQNTLSRTQEKEVEEKASRIVTDYEKYCGFTEFGDQISELYFNKFKELFSDDAEHYNDFDPGIITKSFSINSYFSNIRNLYPEGLGIHIDEYKFERPEYNSKLKKYEIIAKIQKEIYGYNDQSKTEYSESIPLFLKITFTNINNTISDFKITGVTIENPTLYIFPMDEMPQDKEAMKRSKNTQGFYIDVFFSPGVAHIKTEDSFIENQSLNSKSRLSYSFGSDLTYFIASEGVGIINIGFGSGLNFTKYGSKYTLSSFNQDSVRYIDIDGDTCQLLFNGQLLENKVSVMNLEIPIFVDLRYNSGKGFLDFIELRIGLKAGIPIISKSETNGTYSYRGYYSNLDVELSDIPYYNYYQDKEETFGGDLNLNSTNLSFFTDLIAAKDLNNGLNLNFGFKYIRGITSMIESNNNKIISTEYGKINSLMTITKKAKGNYFGIFVGLSFEL